MNTATANEPSAGDLRVLVVDDNADAATSFCYLLQVLGCKTAVAFDGATAVQLSALFKPQLSFIDLDMPELDGCTTVALIRALEPKREQMIVCLSGRSEPDDARRSLEAGFDAFVSKPLEPQPLAELLAACMARYVQKVDAEGGQATR